MNKAQKIFFKLHEKSKRGEINWEETEKQAEFQAALPAYSIRIGKEEDETYGTFYLLKIFNQEGRMIEEIGAGDIAEGIGSMTAQGQMKELHEMARRTAMRVEEALDSILSELGE